MSIRTPSSRAELLHQLARVFAEASHESPISFGLVGQTDGYLDIAVHPLPATDPVGATFGFIAPAEWLAIGFAGGATCTTTDNHHREHVRFAYIIDRHGMQASVARHDDSEALLIDYHNDRPEIGRIPDSCRRALGLPTPPPNTPTRLFWILDWLDSMIAAVLRRDLGSVPPDWPTLEALLRIRPDSTHPWAILRRESRVRRSRNTWHRPRSRRLDGRRHVQPRSARRFPRTH